MSEHTPLSKFARFHTPGPWSVGNGSTWINGPDNKAIAQAVADNFGTSKRPQWATAKANARLVAAAPAMEDALALLADLVGGMNVDGIEGTTTIGGQYATTVVSALEAARVALEAAAPEPTPRVTATRKGATEPGA